MSPLQTLTVAFRALMINKLRSFLTMLGVIIGVAAVVAMVAIGEGAKAQVEASFASMGSNLVIVMSGSAGSGGSHGGMGSQPTLTWDDFRAIRREASAVRYAAASMRTNAQVMAEEQNWSTTIVGSSPEMFLIRNWRVVKGDTFTDADVRGGAKVAVLGQSVADRLFPGRSPLGQTIRIKKTPFQVVGVLEPKGQSAMGQDYDDAVYVPHTSWQSQVQGGLQKYIPGMILVSAATPELTSRAMAQVTAILRDRHHLQQGEDDDFFVRDLTEMSNAMQQGTQTLSALLASIAAVSLLVGGIGIMNIMLVSVTERTREIGLRMAIGARPGVILRQFLVEAMVLSFTGGIIGILAGSGIGWYLAQQFDWPVALRGDVMLLALGFSAAVGIGFGLYPARLASRLDPIDALRYE